jgi:putative nucleotidyltransferase with HDIG domain
MLLEDELPGRRGVGPMLVGEEPVATRRAPRLPRATTGRYVMVLCVAAVGSFLVPPTWSVPVEQWRPAAVALAVLSVVLEFEDVPLPRGGALSVATIAHVAAILLVPAPYAALLVAIGIGLEQLVRRRQLIRMAYNVASVVVTISFASAAVGLLGSPWVAASSLGAVDHLRLGAAVMTAIVVYYAVNIVLTAAVIATANGRPFSYVLRVNTRHTRLSELGAAALGALFALVWMIEPLWTICLALPSVAIGLSFQQIRRLETETEAAVKASAETVESRDPWTRGHSPRVATYASALAVELQLDDDLAELIELVAAVHDLGKVGIPDAVLIKPGPLDPVERALMQTHAAAGAEILSKYSMFRPGAAIVRHHHENYDGTGYPDGLVGQAIPLGARVLAVADAFDAMTSDRPYRAALPLEEALRRLRSGAGTQWDPVVAGTFLRAVIEARVTVPSTADMPGPQFVMVVEAGLSDAAAPERALQRSA